MSHVRQQIREQMASELVAAASSNFSTRVSTTRLRPVDTDELPAVFISNGPEAIGQTLRSATGRNLRREYNVRVNVHAAANDGLDDLLDACCKDVEAVLGPSILNGLAKSLTLSQTDFVYNEEFETARGVASMTWTVLYVTSEADASQAL